MSATPRLYIEAALAAGADVTLGANQSHYLARVMRLGKGATIRVFNGRDGEFSAEIGEGGKSALQLRIIAASRAQSACPDLWLLFAPLKKARTDFVVEKATELGVAEIRPVLTERCEAETVRNDRLQRIAVEAAEQTERLDVPPVREAATLHSVLSAWPGARILYFCDEAGDEGGKPWGGERGRAAPIAGVMAGSGRGPAAILTGPEGGFSPAERAHLRGLPFVRVIGLGPRILRAETAAIAALAIWQSVAGDWKTHGDPAVTD